eukprot:6205339-Pleurochrysis_carterae.AAC.2
MLKHRTTKAYDMRPRTKKKVDSARHVLYAPRLASLKCETQGGLACIKSGAGCALLRVNSTPGHSRMKRRLRQPAHATRWASASKRSASSPPSRQVGYQNVCSAVGGRTPRHNSPPAQPPVLVPWPHSDEVIHHRCTSISAVEHVHVEAPLQK